MRRALIGSMAWAALAAPAAANDTQASTTLGGLIFEQNDQISMDSEELYLSLDKVRVRYTYTNHGTRPVTLLVAFPLPDVPIEGTDPEWVESSYPDWDTIDMKTLVDGKPVGLMRIDIAKLNGKDIDKRLKELGWPVAHWADPGFAARLNALSADDKSELLGEGLITTEYAPEGEVRPAWTVSTSFVRTQTFPPGVPITVEHSYVPMQGGTVGSGLGRDAREANGGRLDPESEYITKYCVDDAFLRGYDRKRYLPTGAENELVFPLEQWVGYALRPGANWKGPIKRFRLTVDKGESERLVSLCMDGIRKVSPTRFEVIKTDYEPTSDIDLLFVTFAPLEGGQ
ncbi:DUF4424 family protein [Blastomonas sp.]|uniref:DUF4424 family protein n=1 Tax=Blastomonas sp. TaxID=1909299 RepID=UPI00406A5091